jgi:ferric iron reductase FhuF-like transporter
MRPVEGQISVAPIARTLDRVSAAGDGGMDLSSRTRVPDEPGWVRVDELAADRSLLADIMDRIGRAYGEDGRPFTGTSLLRGYLWRMLTPAVAAFLLERRLPDARAESVALRFGGGGSVENVAFAGKGFVLLPQDPDAAHPAATVLPSDGEVLFSLRDALAETHLAVLAPALRDLGVRRGSRALGQVFADSCAEAFMFVGRHLGREAEGVGLAGTLLAGPSPLSAPLNHRVLEYPGGTEATRVRNTCCLYYKTGNGVCFTCPRKTDEERVRELLSRKNGSGKDGGS